MMGEIKIEGNRAILHRSNTCEVWVDLDLREVKER